MDQHDSANLDEILARYGKYISDLAEEYGQGNPDQRCPSIPCLFRYASRPESITAQKRNHLLRCPRCRKAYRYILEEHPDQALVEEESFNELFLESGTKLLQMGPISQEVRKEIQQILRDGLSLQVLFSDYAGDALVRVRVTCLSASAAAGSILDETGRIAARISRVMSCLPVVQRAGAQKRGDVTLRLLLGLVLRAEPTGSKGCDNPSGIQEIEPSERPEDEF